VLNTSRKEAKYKPVQNDEEPNDAEISQNDGPHVVATILAVGFLLSVCIYCLYVTRNLWKTPAVTQLPENVDPIILDVSLSPSIHPSFTSFPKTSSNERPESIPILQSKKSLEEILSMAPDDILNQLTYADLHIDDPEANMAIRLKYYFPWPKGNTSKPDMQNVKEDFTKSIWWWDWYRFCSCGLKGCRIKHYPRYWSYDLCEYLDGLPHDTKFLLMAGDWTPGTFGYGHLPMLTKVRRFDEKSVLLYLNTKILGYKPMSLHDISFEDKKPIPVWVGTNTGYDWPYPRGTFVMNYHEKFSETIHLTSMFWERETLRRGPEFWNKYIGPRIEEEEQLQYRYLISLEGNDIATNLRWILTSNSVPILPNPTIENWYCFRLLEPYVHYLPLNKNLDDLEEVMYWCEQHLDECKQIAINGQIFMSQFNNQDAEKELNKEIIRLWISEFASA